MFNLREIYSIAFCLFMVSISDAQVLQIGGACEGCEAIFENKIPFEELSYDLTLPSSGDGLALTIMGKVFKRDGRTLAPDVVLYVYHTDQQGRYTAISGAKGWEKRHGSIRGWLKTNAKGEYIIHTRKPSPYPNDNIAAHIHVFLKEPNKNPYWIEEYVFEGDPYLNLVGINKPKPRGGSGVLTLLKQANQWIGKRDIVLGLNIPDYK